LRQLAALEFTTTETGTVRISVPERAGHDDLCSALALSAHDFRPRSARGDGEPWSASIPCGPASPASKSHPKGLKPKCHTRKSPNRFVVRSCTTPSQ
jgi:hypothetical protein